MRMQFRTIQVALIRIFRMNTIILRITENILATRAQNCGVKRRMTTRTRTSNMRIKKKLFFAVDRLNDQLL